MSTKLINKNPQEDIILSIYDTDPINPTPSLMYYNKPINQIRFFNGYIWGSVGMVWDDPK